MVSLLPLRAFPPLAYVDTLAAGTFDRRQDHDWYSSSVGRRFLSYSTRSVSSTVLEHHRIYVHQPGDTGLQQRQEEMHWLTRLHQTLTHDRLCLYYQPIVPLGQSTTDGTRGEILLRLIDDRGQVLLPGAFILAADS